MTPLRLLVLGAAAIWAGYPNRRVCNYMEFATDGWASDEVAHTLQLLLEATWSSLFSSGAHDPRGEVLDAVESYVARSNGSLLELASGSGRAAALWVNELAKRGSSAKVVLTDLQPNIPAWRRLSSESGGRVAFAPNPVDATNIPEHLSQGGTLRMIHLALHHFPPALVRDILADVVRSGDALLVGDCVPSAQNLVMLNVVGAMTQGPVLQSRPLHHALIMPVVGTHDGVVSVLRSYSPGDLEELAAGLPGGEHYGWQFFHSQSALSMLVGPWAEALGAAPLLQWSLFSPRT